MKVRIVSWNVNGFPFENETKINSFRTILSRPNTYLGLQEFKKNKNEVGLEPKLRELSGIPNSCQVNINSTRGYSGLCTIGATPYSSSIHFDIEGYEKYCNNRITFMEIPELINYFGCNVVYVNVYIPNSGSELVRLDFKARWMENFIEKMETIRDKYPDTLFIIGGDMNIVPTHLDIKNFKGNWNKSPGCTEVETQLYYKALKYLNLVDVEAHLKPDSQRNYTFFGRFVNRNLQYNAGWRLDHFWVSPEIIPLVKELNVLTTLHGSDHFPLELILEYGSNSEHVD